MCSPAVRERHTGLLGVGGRLAELIPLRASCSELQLRGPERSWEGRVQSEWVWSMFISTEQSDWLREAAGSGSTRSSSRRGRGGRGLCSICRRGRRSISSCTGHTNMYTYSMAAQYHVC